MATQAEEARLVAFIKSHGHAAFAEEGKIMVCSANYEQTHHGAIYINHSWESIRPTEIAVSLWLLEKSK